MVKEIREGFDVIIRPLVEARALRDKLAEQVHHKPFAANWQAANVPRAEAESPNPKKSSQIEE
ncbi:MAG: hypothetical protein ACR2IH_12980 [Pyrinomonadaceae bacterium]